jgi:hypothetical protein
MNTIDAKDIIIITEEMIVEFFQENKAKAVESSSRNPDQYPWAMMYLDHACNYIREVNNYPALKEVIRDLFDKFNYGECDLETLNHVRSFYETGTGDWLYLSHDGSMLVNSEPSSNS